MIQITTGFDSFIQAKWNWWIVVIICF